MDTTPPAPADEAQTSEAKFQPLVHEEEVPTFQSGTSEFQSLLKTHSESLLALVKQLLPDHEDESNIVSQLKDFTIKFASNVMDFTFEIPSIPSLETDASTILENSILAIKCTLDQTANHQLADKFKQSLISVHLSDTFDLHRRKSSFPFALRSQLYADSIIEGFHSNESSSSNSDGEAGAHDDQGDLLGIKPLKQLAKQTSKRHSVSPSMTSQKSVKSKTSNSIQIKRLAAATSSAMNSSVGGGGGSNISNAQSTELQTRIAEQAKLIKELSDKLKHRQDIMQEMTYNYMKEISHWKGMSVSRQIKQSEHSFEVVYFEPSQALDEKMRTIMNHRLEETKKKFESVLGYEHQKYNRLSEDYTKLHSELMDWRRNSHPKQALRLLISVEPSPYQLWKLIQDQVGNSFFFKVFENQKSNYGINYKEIDELLRVSQGGTREFERLKNGLIENLNNVADAIEAEKVEMKESLDTKKREIESNRITMRSYLEQIRGETITQMNETYKNKEKRLKEEFEIRLKEALAKQTNLPQGSGKDIPVVINLNSHGNSNMTQDPHELKPENRYEGLWQKIELLDVQMRRACFEVGNLGDYNSNLQSINRKLASRIRFLESFFREIAQLVGISDAKNLEFNSRKANEIIKTVQSETQQENGKTVLEQQIKSSVEIIEVLEDVNERIDFIYATRSVNTMISGVTEPLGKLEGLTEKADEILHKEGLIHNDNDQEVLPTKVETFEVAIQTDPVEVTNAIANPLTASQSQSPAAAAINNSKRSKQKKLIESKQISTERSEHNKRDSIFQNESISSTIRHEDDRKDATHKFLKRQNKRNDDLYNPSDMNVSFDSNSSETGNAESDEQGDLSTLNPKNKHSKKKGNRLPRFKELFSQAEEEGQTTKDGKTVWNRLFHDQFNRKKRINQLQQYLGNIEESNWEEVLRILNYFTNNISEQFSQQLDKEIVLPPRATTSSNGSRNHNKKRVDSAQLQVATAGTPIVIDSNERASSKSVMRNSTASTTPRNAYKLSPASSPSRAYLRLPARPSSQSGQDSNNPTKPKVLKPNPLQRHQRMSSNIEQNPPLLVADQPLQLSHRPQTSGQTGQNNSFANSQYSYFNDVFNTSKQQKMNQEILEQQQQLEYLQQSSHKLKGLQQAQQKQQIAKQSRLAGTTTSFFMADSKVSSSATDKMSKLAQSQLQNQENQQENQEWPMSQKYPPSLFQQHRLNRANHAREEKLLLKELSKSISKTNGTKKCPSMKEPWRNKSTLVGIEGEQNVQQLQSVSQTPRGSSQSRIVSIVSSPGHSMLNPYSVSASTTQTSLVPDPVPSAAIPTIAAPVPPINNNYYDTSILQPSKFSVLHKK